MLSIAFTNFARMIKDRRALLGIFMAPVFIMVFFSFMMGGPVFLKSASTSDTGTASNTPSVTLGIGLINLSTTKDSKALIESLEQHRAFSLTPMTKEKATELIQTKSLKVALLIPPDYQYGNPLTLLESDDEAASVLYETLTSIIKASTIPNAQPVPVEQMIAKPAAQNLSFVLGFVINFMMFSLIYLATEVSDLRRWHLLRRIFTVPHKPIVLMAGLVASMFSLLLAQLFIVNAMSKLLFGAWLIPVSLAGLLLFIPFICLILALGLLVSRIVKNSDYLALAANMIIMPLGMISGTFLPSGMTPAYLTQFAFLTPQYWLVQGLSASTLHLWTAVLPAVAVLSLMSACLLIISSFNAKQWLEA